MQQHRLEAASPSVTNAGSVGAIVAATIGVVIAFAAGRLQLEPWRPYGSFVIDPGGLASAALIGVPIVTWLGGRLANGAAGGTWKQALVRAVWMAVLAVVLGSVATVLVVVALELPGSSVGVGALVLLPYLVAAPIVGIVVFGPLAIAVTLPAAIVWVVILRKLVRPPGPPGSPGPSGPSAPNPHSPHDRPRPGRRPGLKRHVKTTRQATGIARLPADPSRGTTGTASERA